MRPKFCVWPALFLLVLGTTGGGSFLARRMAQAPNTYLTGARGASQVG